MVFSVGKERGRRMDILFLCYFWFILLDKWAMLSLFDVNKHIWINPCIHPLIHYSYLIYTYYALILLLFLHWVFFILLRQRGKHRQ